MEPSVSPLPIPLWPMLALSLALFGATAIAVTVTASPTGQTSATYPHNMTEIATPALIAEQKRAPLAARANVVARATF